MQSKLLAAALSLSCLTAWAGDSRSAAHPAFCLPARIYAAPGLELNVYFANVFDSVVPQNFAFQAYCSKGRSLLRRWCFTPSKEDAGKEYKLIVNAWNDDGLAAAATSVVEVARAPRDPSRRITLALLGDSLTNGLYQDRVFEAMRSAGFGGYEPVGSRALNGKVKHDGYGGYTFYTFLTWYKVSEEEVARVQDAAEREQLKVLGVPEKIIHGWQKDLLRSPLLKFENGKKIVDIPRWLGKINGGKAPDVLLFQLGVNGVFALRGEPPELHKNIRWGEMESAKALIKTLRPFMPNTLMFVCTSNIGANQDAFGENYGSGWNEIQHRKNIFALNRELDAFVRRSNDPLLKLLPVGHAVDPVGGYPYAERPESAQSETKVMRAVNAVHLSAAGGRQMGDAIAAALMAHLADGNR